MLSQKVTTMLVLGIILAGVPNSYAQFGIPENIDEENLKKPLESIIDITIRAIQNMVTNSELPEDEEEQINKFIDQSGDTGKLTTSLWISMHKSIISAVSLLGDDNFPKGIALVASFVIGTILIALILWKFFKHAWKIILIVITLIAIIWIIPFESFGIGLQSFYQTTGEQY